MKKHTFFVESKLNDGRIIKVDHRATLPDFLKLYKRMRELDKIADVPGKTRIVRVVW